MEDGREGGKGGEYARVQGIRPASCNGVLISLPGADPDRDDGNWTAVVGNIWKARRTWEHLLRILGWEWDDTRTSGRL